MQIKFIRISGLLALSACSAVGMSMGMGSAYSQTVKVETKDTSDLDQQAKRRLHREVLKNFNLIDKNRNFLVEPWELTDFVDMQCNAGVYSGLSHSHIAATVGARFHAIDIDPADGSIDLDEAMKFANKQFSADVPDSAFYDRNEATLYEERVCP